MSRNIAVIVGSLRKESFSRKLANALIPLARPALDLKLIEIGDLELYNEDTEKNPTRAWTAFRDAVRPVNAVLFVTPEYNRSVPGCLKNAVDVGSRPYGSSVWSGKPAAIISNSVHAKLRRLDRRHCNGVVRIFSALPRNAEKCAAGTAAKLASVHLRLSTDATCW